MRLSTSFLKRLRNLRAFARDGRLSVVIGYGAAVFLASVNVFVWLPLVGMCLLSLFAGIEIYRSVRWKHKLPNGINLLRYKCLVAIVIAQIPLFATMHTTSAGWILLATGFLFLAMYLAASAERVQEPLVMANIESKVIKVKSWGQGTPVIITVTGIAVLGVSGVHSSYALVLSTIVLVWQALWFKWMRVHSDEGALERIQPRFIIPYTAKSGFHIPLWEPYLKKLNLPYLIIVVHPETFKKVAKMTEAPVILLPQMSVAGAVKVVPKSVWAAFYMCNNDENKYFLANKRVTSIWLHHGDSDKHVCAVQKSAQYDHLFVAGQAAIDRYAENGIEIPREKFTIIGRPQVGDIRFCPKRNQSSRLIVAYAPTWQKQTSIPEHRYSSLVPMGMQIVTALIAMDAAVIFRPHPLSKSKVRKKQHDTVLAIQQLLQEDKKASGREHVWGKKAETTWSVIDVCNHSDALVSDVSSVVTDYMQSGKPFAMASPYVSAKEFRSNFPSAKGAYVMEASKESIREALDAMLNSDPLKDLRLERREYYLGGFEDCNPERIFLTKAKGIICGN